MREGWEIKKLDEVAIFQRGLTYSKKDEVEMSSNIVLRANNVDFVSNKLDFTELRYINKSIKIPNEKKVRKGSLIICTASGSKSHLGKVALIDDDYDYAFGGFMGQLTPSKEMDSNYFFYVLTSNTYKKFISELSDGVNINNLRFDDLKEFSFPIPPLSEQKSIVAILDEAFAAIEKAKANSEKNLQNAKELFESYLQNVFTNPGDDWEEKKLKEIGITQTGTTPKTVNKENYGNFIPFIKPADVDFTGAGDIRYDNEGLSEIGLRKGRKMESDSILMVCIGATIGKVGFTERTVSCNQQINSLTVNKGFEPKFIYYAMTSRKFQDLVLIEGKGAQATLPIINKSKWENLPISFPKSKKEQQAIVSKLDALSVETKKLETIYQQKLNKLEELKKSILQKAFNGELTAATKNLVA
jgi:type I restriction enzyme S subunit